MKRLFLLLFVATAFLFTSCKEESNTQVELVTPEEMQELTQLEDVQLIDVRTPEEYKEGHIVNSQNIDYYSENFENEIQELDKTKPVILYCKSGTRSGKCVDKMKDAGFVKIYDLDGGITKWKFKGYDIELRPLP